MYPAKSTWTIWEALSSMVILGAIFLANKASKAPLILLEDVRHLHEKVTELWSEGQLAIDLFPPLSHVADLKPWVDSARLWIWPVNATIWLSCFGTPWISSLSSRLSCFGTSWIWSHFYWLFLLGAIAVGSSQEMTGLYVEDDMLVSCNALSDGVLYLALILAMSGTRPGSILWYGLHVGLSDALIWTGVGLGGNTVDFCLAWMYVFGWRLNAFAITLADQQTPMLTISVKATTSFLMSLVAWPMVYNIIIGGVIPWSESASNMNHNLHYLSPSARRHLTPFPSIADVQWSDSRTDLALYGGAQYTLYIPGAGFLWSDNLVWAQRLPEKSSGNEVKDDPWAVDEAKRVYFEDKHVRRYPWLIQPVPRPNGSRKQQSRTKTESILPSGANVKVMDPERHEYLCVIPEQHIVSEAGYFPENDQLESDEDEDIMTRLAVGVRPEMPRNCEWRIYYDMSSADGIVILNEQNNCRLATTFRSLPSDISGPSHNKSDSFGPGAQLEASCSVHANDASSRLHLIERKKPGSRANRRREPTNMFLRSLMIGYEYQRAVHKLDVFQSRYSDLQQGQGGPAPGRHGTPPEHNLLSLGCVSFLCAWTGIGLARKRGILTSSRVQPGMEGVFVLVHILLYYTYGFSMPYTSRVAALMAISGLTRLVQEALYMPSDAERRQQSWQA